MNRKIQRMSDNQIDDIYSDGFLNGIGDSSKGCKFPVGTEEYNIWEEGREDGFNSYFKSIRTKAHDQKTKD